VNYRLYQPDDFDQIYAIEETCFQPPIRFPRRYVRHMVESDDCITWIAEEGSNITGFTIADFRYDAGEQFAYIATIELLPDVRGRGAGSELLRRIEQSAREKGARSIWLHVEPVNAAAIRLYESRGFTCVGRQENYYARGRAGLVYRKLLETQS